MKRYRWLVVLASAWAAALPARANPIVPVPLHQEPYALDSGLHSGRPEETSEVFREEVRVPGTVMIRLHFGDYDLGADSFVVLTSLADDDAQRFDAESLDNWYGASGYFKGDAVAVELFVAPGDVDVFVTLDQVTVTDPAEPPSGPIADPEGICGDFDNRSRSTDSRVGRIRVASAGSIATGWLVASDIVLTAGHAGDPDGALAGSIMEFNVPSSGSNGSVQPAALADQYPVNTSGLAFESDGTGEDYAVLRLNPNANGRWAHDVQDFFRITTTTPPESATMRVTGYGNDPYPPGTSGGGNSDAWTQQTAVGRFDERDGSTLEYEVDTMGGDSGAPVIRNATGFAVGIHTAGGCDDFISGYENHGTWFGYGPLYDAIDAFNPSNRFWVDRASQDRFQTGGVLTPFRSVGLAVLNVPSNAEINIIGGNYSAASGNTFIAGQDGKRMTLIGQLGTAVIGQ